MGTSKDLQDIRKMAERIIERIDKIAPEIDRLEKESVANQPISPEPLKVKFGSKIEAIHQVLKEEGRILYIDEIVSILKERYSATLTRNTASGMLRRYSAEGRIFKAEGGNRFSLLEQSGKK